MRNILSFHRVEKVIEYDFTKSDYGFTYSTSNAYVSTYGQSSNGLGVTNKTTTGRGAVSWTIPTRATGKIFKKAELIFTGTPAGYGCGLAVGVDTKVIRLLQALRVVWGTQNTTSANVATAANSEIKIIIDLENKTLSSNVNSTIATLTDNAISAFTTDRLAGNVKLSVITMDTASSKSYCKKLILSY